MGSRPVWRRQSVRRNQPQLYSADLVAQNLTQYFGKILRIDVDSSQENTMYGIPDDNPFVGNDMAYPPEIYAWGFRNPFRISFDRNDYSSRNNGTFPYFPLYVSATAETLYESTYKVDGPGNYGWAIREGTRCIARSQPLVPPYTVDCTVDSECPSGPQTMACGSDGFCTCTDTDPILGGPIHDPIIEYVNLAVNEFNESAALVEEGLIDGGLGRASLGGFIYRGSAIPCYTASLCKAILRSICWTDRFLWRKRKRMKVFGVSNVLMHSMRPIQYIRGSSSRLPRMPKVNSTSLLVPLLPQDSLDEFSRLLTVPVHRHHRRQCAAIRIPPCQLCHR